jgi:hypothetical protein
MTVGKPARILQIINRAVFDNELDVDDLRLIQDEIDRFIDILENPEEED